MNVHLHAENWEPFIKLSGAWRPQRRAVLDESQAAMFRPLPAGFRAVNKQSIEYRAHHGSMGNDINKLILTNKQILMEILHISSRGQIVIPERVRKQLQLKEGMRLILVQRGDTLILRKEETVEEFLDAKGWTALSEQSLKDAWDNPDDEKEWKKYL
jgi:AbrB family looped-hinge helix DNA binding protein